MLRRDTGARFESSGFWIFRSYRFTAGRLDVSFSRGEFEALLQLQGDEPVKVMSEDTRRRTWWMYLDDFYWEDDGLEPLAVKALVLQRLNQQERRIQRAITLMESDAPASETRRGFIPQEIRLEVFRRDQGRCVNCGSDRDLQFDHVIPVALGGATSEANLQLLCTACNRDKGASLA